jgi:hypothetical protein
MDYILAFRDINHGDNKTLPSSASIDHLSLLNATVFDTVRLHAANPAICVESYRLLALTYIAVSSHRVGSSVRTLIACTATKMSIPSLSISSLRDSCRLTKVKPKGLKQQEHMQCVSGLGHSVVDREAASDSTLHSKVSRTSFPLASNVMLTA